MDNVHLARHARFDITSSSARVALSYHFSTRRRIWRESVTRQLSSSQTPKSRSKKRRNVTSNVMNNSAESARTNVGTFLPRVCADSNYVQKQVGDHSAKPPHFVKCEFCKKNIEHASYDMHIENHIRQQHRTELEAELEDTADDKQGVIVSGRHGIDSGILDEDQAVDVKISIQSTNSRVSLKACKMRSSTRGDEHGVK